MSDVKDNVHQCDLCDYKSKRLGNLKNHMWFKHDIPSIPSHKYYSCTEDGCDSKFKTKDNLNRHKWSKHNISSKASHHWHCCKIGDCDYKCKSNGNLQDHQWKVHNIQSMPSHKLYECTENGCESICKSLVDLQRHQWNVHNIPSLPSHKLYECVFDGCNKSFKTFNNVQHHAWQIHDIPSLPSHQIYPCTENECDHKFKTLSNLYTHHWKVHSIQSMPSHKLYECSIDGCTHVYKSKGELNRHKSHKHDIGDKQCKICYRNYYYLSKVTVNGEVLKACNNCTARSKNTTRKETKMVKRIQRDDRLKPYIALADQIISHQSCETRRRPDLLLSMPCNLHIIIECDEYEHSTYESKCETGRMNEIMDEFKEGKIVFIRWNPDTYDLREHESKKVRLNQRLDMLVELIHHIIHNLNSIPPVYVYYMFYSDDNENISSTLPHHNIHRVEDFAIPEPENIQTSTNSRKRKRFASDEVQEDSPYDQAAKRLKVA